MIRVIQNSAIYRFIISFIEIYKKGVINNALTSLKIHYKTSKTAVIFENFVAKSSIYEFSLYNKILAKINSGVEILGEYYEQSIFCKIFNFFVNLFCKITNNSLFFKPFRTLGFKGLLLVIFGLYLPVDYILRNVLQIAMLSSVWDELLLVVFIITILYRQATKNLNLGTRATPIDAFLYIFIAVSLFLMCFVSPNFGIAVDGFRAVVQYLLWFFAVVRLIETDRDFKILYNTFVAMIILLGLHCIYQFIVAVPIPATWTTQSEMSVRTRVFSLTGSPNVMGSILVLMTPMITALAYKTKNFKVKILAWGTAVMLCLALLFTFSKGAWFGMAVAVLVFAIFLDRRIIALALAGATGVVIFVPSVVNRITYLFTDDYVTASLAGGRMLRWDTGLALLHQAGEFFGFGLGRFGGAVAMQNQVIDGLNYFYMDNYYLKTLVEMGYLGLGFYILLLVATVFVSIKAIGRTRNTELFAPCVGLFSGMCGVLVHLYYENIFEVPYMNSYFWAMAAMLMYAGFIRKHK